MFVVSSILRLEVSAVIKDDCKFVISGKLTRYPFPLALTSTPLL